MIQRFGRIVVVVVLWAVALSVLVDQYVVSGTAPLWPMPPNAGWITPATDSDRAYFRREWDLGAQPTSAWIAVAAEDYRLYVNGTLVGWNSHWHNAGLAFQNKVSDRGQSLTAGRVLKAARSPTAFMRGNREWGIAQVFEIDRLLRPGRNVIAIYVQDAEGAKFKAWGGATLATGPIKLGPERWRYALVEQGRGEDPWYSPRRVDESWEDAVPRKHPDRALFSRVPVACWSLPFEGVLATLRPDEMRGGARFRAAEPLGQSVWLRVYATRHTEVVVDGTTILSAPPEHRLWIVDVSDYADAIRDGFEVRFSDEGQTSLFRAPMVAVDLVSDDRVVPIAAASNAASGGATREQILRIGNVRKSVTVLRPDVARQMQVVFGSVMRWTLAPVVVLLLAWSWRRDLGIANANDLGMKILAPSVPALVFLAGVEFLRFRLFESDTYLLFVDERVRALVPLIFVALLLVCSIRAFARWDRMAVPRLDWSDERVVRRAVLVLLAIAAVARIVTLGVEPLQADENVSWDAARGILHTGVPRAVSGVLYTRSPFYHYLLAGWLAVFGDTLLSARLFAIPWAVGAIYLSFLIARRVTGSSGAALAATGLLTLDPLQIGIAGLIRFYQPMQFFSLLCVWTFIRGFLDREVRYQDWFFVAATCGILSQEVFVTLLPAFCIAFYLYYRPFSWRDDMRIPVGFSLMVAILIVDVATFSFLCLTPHVGIGTTSGSITQLNLRDVMSFSMSFLAGHNRSHVLYVIGFLGGGFLVRKHAPRERVLVILVVATTLVALTLLVLQVAQRYMVSIYPLLVIGAVTTLYDSLVILQRKLLEWTGRPRFTAFLYRTTMACVALVLIINVEYPKTLGAFESPRVLEHQYALEKIAVLRQPSDKIMSVHPMPAAILFGGIDYYLENGSSFDEVYQNSDRIVDRWAGGRLVSRVSELRDLFEENERIWIVMDAMEKPKLRQAVKTFLYESCSVQFEFKDGQVLLWERGAGRLSTLVNHE